MEPKKAVSLALALSGIGTAILFAGCAHRGDQAKENRPGSQTAGQPVRAEATPVRVAGAVRTTVRRVIPVTGSISALQTVSVSPKVAARVVSVVGREGAPVRAGQVVVQQDTSDFLTQVQQAEANVNSAKARLSQAQTQARVEVTSSSTAVLDAQEQLQGAQAQLALAQHPQRTQEIAIAENAVGQAQANYDKAEVDRRRYEQLVKEGAAAQSVLEQYATQEKVARAALDSAKQQLNIAQTGGREESVRAAETAVARARAAERLARANTQQNDVRRDEIQAARAAVVQARAALDFARQQLANASIRSPIDGVISARLTEPGQQAAPGASVLQLIALDNVFFEARVPETDVRSVREGMSVGVHVDAFPGRAFSGRVAKVYPTASTQSRNFMVRVVLPNSGKLLRPGMFARGDVVAETRKGTMVPKDALLSRDGKVYVFVVGDNGKAALRDVRVGIQTAETAEIVSGVRPDERVIVAGQDTLVDGGAVRIQGREGVERAAAAR